MDNIRERYRNRKFFISIGGDKVFYESKKRTKPTGLRHSPDRKQLMLPGFDDSSDSEFPLSNKHVGGF